MAREPSEVDSVQGRAIRLGADVRRRRLAAGLTQQMLAGRIGYDRSYLSQVETGAQIPAEQFILQCEHELTAEGALLGVFRGAADRTRSTPATGTHQTVAHRGWRPAPGRTGLPCGP
jgi:transcriptional regulator with XRE-family HTH domain